MFISTLFRRIFIVLLAISLLGYAFLGRGYAYIGVPPVYVDAFLWGLALITLLFNPGWLKLFRLPHTWPLLAFMVWGFVRTIPYIAEYGVEALRDGVVWGYGLFSLAVGYVVFRDRLIWRAAIWYRRWFFRFVFWAPLALLTYYSLGEHLPRFPWGPGGGVPVLSPKGGDIAVHLAGVLSFALLLAPRLGKQYASIHKWMFWIGWLAGIALVVATVRAAFLAVALVVIILVFHVNPVRWVKPVSLLLFFVVLLALTGITIDTGRERKVSFDQLYTNAISIFGNAEGFSGEGSKRWRLEWWKTILQYTVFGKYFWTGKGFGINLADDDGFQVTSDHSLRSPHNGHLTILARAGVPGAFLWLLLQGWFALSLWLGYWRKRLRGEPSAGFYLWIFTYWLAAMVNAAFDVYLEGPQGGVWFWSVYGFGLGLILSERYLEHARSDTPHPLPATRG